MKNIGLCFSGSLRSLENILNNINKNLIKINKNKLIHVSKKHSDSKTLNDLLFSS